jgi:hypothetical protein
MTGRFKGRVSQDSDELTLENFVSQVKGRWMNFQVADRPIYRMSWWLALNQWNNRQSVLDATYSNC